MYFTGRIMNVIFENASQSFYILRVKLDQETDEEASPVMDMSLGTSVVTVKGNIPGLNVEVGTWFGFEGNWINHPSHGRQIDITRAPMVKGPWDTKTILKVLTAHGVGAITLKLLSDKFGDGLQDVLMKPEKLMEVKGIDAFTAEHLVSRWKAVKATFQTISFLGQLAIPKAALEQVWAKFGDDIEDVLAEDPWALIQVPGIEFKVADEVALKSGASMDNPLRVKGAVLYVARTRRGMGHLYVQTGELASAVKEVLGAVQPAQIAQALKTLHEEGFLMLDRVTKPGLTAVYETWLFNVEESSARLLAARQQSAAFSDPKEIEDYIKRLAFVGPQTTELAERSSSLEEVAREALREWTSASKVSLGEKQLQGALNALIHPVSVLTGLPGTGKTFCLKTVVKVLQDAEVEFLLVAPTGIAAKRVQSVTGAEASTIHRAFQAKGINGRDDRQSTYAGIVGESDLDISADGSQEEWGFSQESPHSAEVIIVDESSMVDQHLMFRILSCTDPKCRIVLVGDSAQLPSVGPGNVLRDLIDSGSFPVTNLSEIYRQEDTSDIILAAHAINSGKIPKPTPGKKDFGLAQISRDQDILDKLLESVDKLYRAHVNFQVLSPRHAGALGVTNLNSRIRELINPKQPGLQEMRMGSETIREGDRVIVVRNNYRYEIFNGDVGKIVSLDRKKKEVEVRIWGPPEVLVRLPFKEASSHLRLAYCITVHKSQGQEYDVILMPWVKGFGGQLQRNLIYTAITRAKKKVCLFGHPEALAIAVQNNEVVSRNTLLPDRLRRYLED